LGRIEGDDMSKTYEADDYAGIAARLKEIQDEKLVTAGVSLLSEQLPDNMLPCQIEYFAQNLYMPWWLASISSETDIAWTDEEIAEYARNIPSYAWPSLAYIDNETDERYT
jgi:hypothetical protein